MITGSLVAIITPMRADGSLDLARFKNLIDWHVAEGTDGIVVVGTTGESPTVNVDEHKELIRIAVGHSHGRIPIIAGTVDLPTILYTVTGRTVADLQNATVLRLAQVPGIIGIKDATANIERGTDLIRRAPRNFAIYSGEDATALALILLGGHGV